MFKQEVNLHSMFGLGLRRAKVMKSTYYYLYLNFFKMLVNWCFRKKYKGREVRKRRARQATYMYK